MRQVGYYQSGPEQRSMFPEITFSGPFRCRGCQRELSSAKSIERGYGTHCWVKHLEKMVKNESEDVNTEPTDCSRRTG